MKLSLIAEATTNQVERRIPIWANKYFEGDIEAANKVIPKVIVADPTNGKYSEWLIRRWRDGEITDDPTNLKSALEIFDHKKSKLPDKDIHHYTVDSLLQTINQQFNLTKSERRRARRGDMDLPPGAKLLGTYGDMQVVEITNFQAASILSSGTRWCTVNPRTARSYLNNNPLYMIFVDGRRAYLAEYSFLDIRDINNKRVNIKTTLAVHEAISQLKHGKDFNEPASLFHVADTHQRKLPSPYHEILLNSSEYGDNYDNLLASLTHA